MVPGGHISNLVGERNQPDEEALALEGTGECHLHAGDVPAGIAHLEQARKIFQRVGPMIEVRGR